MRQPAGSQDEAAGAPSYHEGSVSSAVPDTAHVPRPRSLWSPWGRLAGLPDSPHRIAAAFALGVFLSFSPFLGLQIVSGLALAFVLRVSRAAVLVGLCTNVPWVSLPWYTGTTMLGATLLRAPLDPGFGDRLGALLELPVYRLVFWERAADVLRPLFQSFIVGTTLGAVVLGALAYLAAFYLVSRRVRPSPGP